MAKDPRLHLQVADGHLRLMPQGDLTEPKIKQILRAAEVGLRVFPLVVVDLRTSKGSTESAINLLEEGLQQIIAKRKHVLLNPQGTDLGNNSACSSNSVVVPARGKGSPRRSKLTDNLAAQPVHLIVSRSDLSHQG
jgi:hypothetical protein